MLSAEYDQGVVKIEANQHTVKSRYLEFQGTLWNTSRYPYLDISDLQNWGKIIRTTTFNNIYVIRLLKLEIYWKYCGKEEKILLFSTIFFNRLLDFHVWVETKFSLRYKRLFEMSEVEITRVNCTILVRFTCFTNQIKIRAVALQRSSLEWQSISNTILVFH